MEFSRLVTVKVLDEQYISVFLSNFSYTVRTVSSCCFRVLAAPREYWIYSLT